MRKTSLALLTGAFFFSSWLQTARFALYSGFKPFLRAEAPQKDGARERLELSQRLERSVKDPGSIGKDDLSAVKKAWGADSERLLRQLKQAAN